VLSTGGGPWWLDGEVGERFILKALDLADPLICAHKNFALPAAVLVATARSSDIPLRPRQS